MTIQQIIFSPTGGTEKVAAILAKALGETHHTIDLCASEFNGDNAAISADDLCIIAVPSYGGLVPATAVSRIASMKGHGAKAVLVAVYGNREFEDTLIQLKTVAESAGFIPIAAVAAIAEHSILRKFAANRPDSADEAELIDFAKQISAKIDAPVSPLTVPGNIPFKESKGSSMKPAANENCTQCGLCAQQCPVRAISADRPEQTNAAMCISCMRCIHVCPANARGLSPESLAFVDQFLTKVASERKGNQLFI